MKLCLTGVLVTLLMFMEVHELSAQAPTEVFPNSMLGFLEPGTHARVRHGNNRQGDREEHFSLHILDDVGWNIASDAKSLPLNELREKYPTVDARASASLAEHKKSVLERNVKPPEGKRLSEPDISMTTDRTLLCTVIHVGDDYVLISYGDAEIKRQVLPMHMINRIYWDDGLPNFSTRSTYVDARESALGATQRKTAGTCDDAHESE